SRLRQLCRVCAAPAAFTAKIRSTDSGRIMPSIAASWTPALITSASSRRNRWKISLVKFFTAAASDTSPATANVSPPYRSEIAFAASDAADGVVACTTTACPEAANRSATARPIPRELPVTRATRGSVGESDTLPLQHVPGRLERANGEHIFRVDHHIEFLL